MNSEKIQEITISFENTLDKSLIVAAVKEQDGLHIKFLHNLRDYVAYRPLVLNPGDKMQIKYDLIKEEI